MNKEVIFKDLGNIRYKEAWDYQTEIFDGIVQEKMENRKREKNGEATLPTKNYLLFCEHPHVYTLGKSGKPEHLLLSDEQLQGEEIDFFKINRGGDITYHGPGQIVGYPIFDLDNFFTDIHKYLRYLEEAIILTLADYDISAGRIDGLTGVWIDFEEGKQNPRKICAMGVKASRWVTMHGFAFNVNADLNYFNNIVPCGISDKAVTSMAQELGREVPIHEVEEKLKGHLQHLFEITWSV
ncbi:lipoyl(octanoyl) transferase LipB [Algivirga pacifica]|uniref:Octanoyltransferase n=1 Tax=Algivirga pacifica TaxID=1162670 RepID=A0ABP9D3T9_9BACT